MTQMPERQSRRRDSITLSARSKKQSRLEIRIGEVQPQRAAKALDGLKIAASDGKAPTRRENLRGQSIEQLGFEMPFSSALNSSNHNAIVVQQRREPTCPRPC